MIKKYYAVRKGRKNNVIVSTWAECDALVTGFPGAVFKGFAGHQYEQAVKFAESGEYKNQNQAKPKTKVQKKQPHSTPHWPCILRKSYKDPITGIYYKNRCVMRQGPRTVGKYFKPHIGNSVPW